MKKYDIVVIGAGLGGLITSTILSREGYSVCVLEKGVQIGGAIQSFSRDNVTFDVGAHYVGGLEQGQNLNQILRFLNVKDKLKLKKLDVDAYDKITFLDQNKEYPHSQGFENFKENLLEFFPAEKKAVDKYIETVINLVNDFPLFKLSEGEYSLFSSKHQNISVGNYLDSITEDENLKNVLAGNNLLYAGEQYSTQLSVQGLIHYSYLESAYRFVGGTSKLAHALADEITANGGEILVKSEVKRFELENGKIDSVVVNEGEKVLGKHFISNMHPTRTFEMIDEQEVRKSYYRRIVNLENTISVFSVYGILKPNSFPFLNSNHYIFRENNVWGVDNYDKQQWPSMSMFLTQPVPGNDRYAKGFTALAYMKFDEVMKWKNTVVGSRGDDYYEFKKLKAQKVLDLVEKKFPGLRDSISNVYSSSPLTYRDYTGTVDGSLYGVVRNVDSHMENLVLPDTKIPNLLFTGQNTTMHGVIGVAIGSLLVCSKFLGMKYLVDNINKA